MIDVASKFFSLLSKTERVKIYVQVVLLIFVAFVDVVGIASILPFMAVVSNPGVVHTNQWLDKTYDVLGFASTQSFLFFLGLSTLCLLVLGNGFKALYTWVSLRFDNQLNSNLACRLLTSYIVRPYESFLVTNSAEMRKNVLSEASLVVSGVVSPAMQILSNGLLCICILALLVVADPWVALGIVFVLGGTYAAIYLVVRQKLAWMGKEQVQANFMKYRAAGEALSGIKDIKILGRERSFLEKFVTHARGHAKYNTQIGTISQLPRFFLETVAFGGILLIVLYSLKAGREVQHIVPLLSMYAFAGYRLMPALQQLFASFSSVRVNLPALNMLHRDMNLRTLVSDPGTILPDPTRQQRLPFQKGLELRGVNFSYAGTKEQAVSDLNLSIAACSSIGLVGPTGSGKTTTVDIILGLLSPSRGRIVVDGVDIVPDNLQQWQRNIGYVPQHIYLCDDTIASNIAFGVPESEIDMEQVVTAAKMANLHDFVARDLPQGYRTVIGEQGVRLSGGQRQRIGIARALYGNPAVLIMDEATSALDGITERVVMEALGALSGKKTVILIAHRLTTVKNCDAIYLMEKGRLVAQGTYDELQETSDWFRAASLAGDIDKRQGDAGSHAASPAASN